MPTAKTAKSKKPPAAKRVGVAETPAVAAPKRTPTCGAIRVGIGGWTFEPWRGVFYPEGLPHAQELAFASRRLTTIEVNGTFYRTQKPATFRSWAAEVPDGFVLSLKAPRYATNRRVLADAGPSIETFLQSGPTELGDKLGPILWQLAATKKFDEDDLGRFLALLPREFAGRRLRHALEARHESFRTPAFVALLRRFGVAVVLAEHETYAQIGDPTADFVYARLQGADDAIETGYRPAALDAWALRLRQLAEGRCADGVALIDPERLAPRQPRDVFAYVIHEGKLRAPAAAQEIIRRIGVV